MELVNTDVINNDDQTRKRKTKNTHLYQRNIIKSAKLIGSSYVNHRKKEVPALIVGESCR